jgi:predicted nucleotidyltransferase
MSKDRIKKVVEIYAQKLKKNKIPFSSIYLFGPFARNQAKETSDIDVAIVSKRKKTDQFVIDVGRYVWDTDTRIEPHIFSEKDFKDVATPLIKEIIDTGIKVA